MSESVINNLLEIKEQQARGCELISTSNGFFAAGVVHHDDGGWSFNATSNLDFMDMALVISSILEGNENIKDALCAIEKTKNEMETTCTINQH